MLTTGEKIREMRCLVVDIVRDKYREEPVSYTSHIDRYKELAKLIRAVLPGYYEMEIKNRYAASIQELTYVVSSCKVPLTCEFANSELSSLLRRMVYMIGFLETHSNFSAIDDRDVEAMQRNFRYIRSRYDENTLDCVSEVLDYFKDIYVISERLNQAGLSNVSLKYANNLNKEKECE